MDLALRCARLQSRLWIRSTSTRTTRRTARSMRSHPRELRPPQIILPVTPSSNSLESDAPYPLGTDPTTPSASHRKTANTRATASRRATKKTHATARPMSTAKAVTLRQAAQGWRTAKTWSSSTGRSTDSRTCLLLVRRTSRSMDRRRTESRSVRKEPRVVRCNLHIKHCHSHTVPLV